MAKIAYPFLILSAIGFTAILIVHIEALLGVTGTFDRALRILGPGLFVVWLPTILIAGHLSRDFKQKDLWRAALRGCPAWMRRTNWVIFGYAWIGFFALPFFFGGLMQGRANGDRSISAVLLAFYSTATAVLYSATRAQQIDSGKRCLNGHRMAPLARFCSECGAPAQPDSGVARGFS